MDYVPTISPLSLTQEIRRRLHIAKLALRGRIGAVVMPATYSSNQATNCAGCGKHKHTPLRIDWMGGYVCLTCIDQELERRDPEMDEGMYYLQDTRGYVGNCPQWWMPGGNGYTTRIDRAGRYTLDEAMKQHLSRATDVPWPCATIDGLRRPTVDMQDMGSIADQVAALTGGPR